MSRLCWMRCVNLPGGPRLLPRCQPVDHHRGIIMDTPVTPPHANIVPPVTLLCHTGSSAANTDDEDLAFLTLDA